MAESNYLKMSVEDAETERSTCGFRRRLLKSDHGAPASVTVLTTHDARPHWHKTTHEYYYVLKGTGKIVIDGEDVPVKAGDIVWIKPPAKHMAEGELESLIIGVPAFHADDMFFDD